MSYEDLDIYCFGGRDRVLVASAELFLRKVTSAKSLRPAQMVSVAKLLHLMSRLPMTSATEMNVTVSVVSPVASLGKLRPIISGKLALTDGSCRLAAVDIFIAPALAAIHLRQCRG
jgi:hypothetical protein